MLRSGNDTQEVWTDDDNCRRLVNVWLVWHLFLRGIGSYFQVQKVCTPHDVVV